MQRRCFESVHLSPLRLSWWVCTVRVPPSVLPSLPLFAGLDWGWAADVSHFFLFHSVRQIDIVSSSTLNLAFLAPLVLSRQPKPSFLSSYSFPYHPDGIESIERERERSVCCCQLLIRFLTFGFFSFSSLSPLIRFLLHDGGAKNIIQLINRCIIDDDTADEMQRNQSLRMLKLLIYSGEERNVVARV